MAARAGAIFLLTRPLVNGLRATDANVEVLLQGRNAGLQPGEEKIGDAGKDSGEQADDGSETEANQFEPKFGTQFAGLGVSNVAQGGVAMHSGVDVDDDDTDRQEKDNQDGTKRLSRVKGVAGNGYGSSQEQDNNRDGDGADTTEDILYKGQVVEANEFLGIPDV